jgi:hypothetical protein
VALLQRPLDQQGKDVTRINNIGDRGSLYHNPLWWAMNSTDTPLRKIWIDEVVNRPLIMSHQICPKHNFFIISIKRAQDIESKAFEISCLNRIRGCFC